MEQETDVSEPEEERVTRKEATEVALEGLIFGDDGGFYDGLRSFKDLRTLSKSEHLGAAIDLEDHANGQLESLEDVGDEKLFFLDTEPSSSGLTSVPFHHTHGEEILSNTGDRNVWMDSDDERMTISLAANSRLRKLRNTETEDVINGTEYIKRLRRQFVRLHPLPQWADKFASRSEVKKKRVKHDYDISATSSSTSEDDISDSTGEESTQPLTKLLQIGGLLSTTSPSNLYKKLRPEIIDVHRLKDIGEAKPCALTSLEFHPSHSLLLTSGPSSILYLHHVSPHSSLPNPLLTSLRLSSTPLTTSVFLPCNGNKIFFSGRRRYFHIWDLDTGHIQKISRTIGHKDEQQSMERFKISPCGKWMGLVGSSRKGGGFVNILDTGTCQWVAEVRVEGKGGVADFDWWGDSGGLVLLGKGGEAVEWDRRENCVVSRWLDEGAVGSTVVALGGRGSGPRRLGGDRWLAVGSSSGIVNVYDRRKWSLDFGGVIERPTPMRAFDNLTTPTSCLEFSPDGQLLCMASRWKRDSLRLVHMPSCTVYRNWPTAQTPFGRITSVAWSPKGEMLAIGNEQGKCRLWEIRG